MLLLPNFQRTLGFFAIRFFRSGCKGRSLYNFNQIFLLFFEVFFFVVRTRRFEELSLFWSGLQSYNLLTFQPNFSVRFRRFFSSYFTRTFEELFAFFRSGRQRYEEYSYQQIFSFTRYSHFYSLSICHLQRTFPICHSLYPLFLSPLTPFTGVSVSNRVAKINSSPSLPNIFKPFFALLFEM